MVAGSLGMIYLALPVKDPLLVKYFRPVFTVKSRRTNLGKSSSQNMALESNFGRFYTL